MFPMPLCGGTCRNAGFGDSWSAEVAAPPQQVWDTIADLEGSVSYLTSVTSVERLGANKDFCEGTRWRETRQYKGDEVILYKTIVAMDEEKYSVSMAVTFTTNETLEKSVKEAANTSTLTVSPKEGDESACILTGVYHVIPGRGGLFSKIMWCWVGCCLTGRTDGEFQKEVQQIATEAEKRYAERDK